MLITRKEDLVGVAVTVETIEINSGGGIIKRPGHIICEHELSKELNNYFYDLWRLKNDYSSNSTDNVCWENERKN